MHLKIKIHFFFVHCLHSCSGGKHFVALKETRGVSNRGNKDPSLTKYHSDQGSKNLSKTFVRLNSMQHTSNAWKSRRKLTTRSTSVCHKLFFFNCNRSQRSVLSAVKFHNSAQSIKWFTIWSRCDLRGFDNFHFWVPMIQRRFRDFAEFTFFSGI